MNDIEGLVILLTYLAVSASAISGALEARKHDMDIVGATTVAFVTAFGGGYQTPAWDTALPANRSQGSWMTQAGSATL